MRVITGSARGRVLETLPGDDVRPTTQKVKEAVFSVLQFEIEGRCVLDLFSGSGQLGIEALSRGAARAVFVDKSKASAECTRRNLKKTGFLDVSAVFQKDSLLFLRSTSEKFDIAFLDPPYSKGILNEALALCAEVMNPGGVIVCEHSIDDKLASEFGDFAVSKAYKYGKVAVTVYRRKSEDDI